MKLPEIKSDLREFEKEAGISVDVICRVAGFAGVWIGRYIHGCECWQVNGMSGDEPLVLEWWTLPEEGTGNGRGDD